VAQFTSDPNQLGSWPENHMPPSDSRTPFVFATLPQISNLRPGVTAYTSDQGIVAWNGTTWGSPSSATFTGTWNPSGTRNYAGVSSLANSWLWGDSLTITGTANNSPTSGTTSPFQIFISGDTVDTTTTGTGLLRAHATILGVQAGHTGVRTGVYASVQVVGTPSSSIGPGKGHEGVEALCFINANLLGTTGAYANYKGGCYGGNHTARIGPNGTFIAIMNGHEFDVAVQSGGSVATKIGSSIVKEGIDTAQGVYVDVAHATFDQDGYSLNNIPATRTVSGLSYKISTVGTTDFTLIGSPNNTVGTFFNATGAGAGTGIVQGELPPWNYVYGLGGLGSQWPCDGTSTINFGQTRTLGTPAAMVATAMQANGGYKIAVVGSTDFTLVGSPTNNVGQIFIATGPAVGTGTVTRGQSVANIGMDYTNILFKTNAIQTQGFSVSPAGKVLTSSLAAIPAAGSLAVGITLTSTANFGVFAGSGAPTLSAAKGSLYIRSDGTTNVTRAYIATDSAGTWTAINTVG
jgi:hypothetical protein